MRSILAPSTLATAAARASTSTSTAPAGPSTRSIACSSTSRSARLEARSYYTHRGATRSHNLNAYQGPSLLIWRATYGLAASGHRPFSSGSISRYVEGWKDRHGSIDVKVDDSAEDKHEDRLDKQGTSAALSPHDAAIEETRPPDSSPSAGTSASSTSSSNTNADHSHNPPASDSAAPSTLLDRLRSVSLDGLTSSTSLSSAVATVTAHTRTLLAHVRRRLSHLSSQYNTHTGYTAIEQLKSNITSLEARLESARAVAAAAKKTYLAAVQQRSTSQRETNDLLSRKNSWSESDLSRYTSLLRTEHALSRHEAEAEKQLERSEADVQACFDELMKAVMVRYHEEQIWSDRMRGMSTYGSLVVAGLNAVLFILAILLVEPYKRKKLAETFEKRLVAAEQTSRHLILDSVDEFRHELNRVLVVQGAEDAPTDAPPLIPPPPADPDAGQTVSPPPIAESEAAPTTPLPQRYERQQEERLVFASTVGVVVGAALSLLIGTCWS